MIAEKIDRVVSEITRLSTVAYALLLQAGDAGEDIRDGMTSLVLHHAGKNPVQFALEAIAARDVAVVAANIAEGRADLARIERHPPSEERDRVIQTLRQMIAESEAAIDEANRQLFGESTEVGHACIS